MNLNTIWPFPEEALHKAAQNAEQVIVPELNLGQLQTGNRQDFPVRPVEGITKVNGEIFAPEEILSRIRGSINAA